MPEPSSPRVGFLNGRPGGFGTLLDPFGDEQPVLLSLLSQVIEFSEDSALVEINNFLRFKGAKFDKIPADDDGVVHE